MRYRLLVLLSLFVALPASADDAKRFDAARALDISQAAIGNVIADHALIAADGSAVRLRSDFDGRPLVVSMIFTTCRNVCPAITRSLQTALAAARDELGADSFDVVTVGFDTDVDTPGAMAAFARRLGIEDPHWQFLSADLETLRALTADVGFIFFPTGAGFDHINQTTVIDGDGRVRAQIYGVGFDPAALRGALGEIASGAPWRPGLVGGVIDRVRLFCTVYDDQTGAYTFDSMRLAQLLAGGVFLLALCFFLIRELLLASRRHPSQEDTRADARR